MQNVKLGLSFINVPPLREIQYTNYPEIDELEQAVIRTSDCLP